MIDDELATIGRAADEGRPQRLLTLIRHAEVTACCGQSQRPCGLLGGGVLTDLLQRCILREQLR